MDEQYIQAIYDQLGGESKFGSFDDFKNVISTNPEYRKQFHSTFGDKTLGSYDDFDALVSGVKKKDSTSTQSSNGASGSESEIHSTSQKEFEERIFNPVLSIDNGDGTHSTHKMASGEVDGKQIAFPTIVNKNGKLIELSQPEAFDYALKTGEYKAFNSKEEAQQYAEGGYKKNTPLDKNLNPFEFTLNETSGSLSIPASEKLPNEEPFEVGDLFKDKQPLSPGEFKAVTSKEFTADPKGTIIKEVVSDPTYNNLTKEEKKQRINARLVEYGAYTPEQIAEQDKSDVEKQKANEERAMADNGVALNTNKKTVYHNGRNYENTPIYHLNDTDYAILSDGTPLKYVGNEWVNVRNQGISEDQADKEIAQVESAKENSEKSFLQLPQNITKNLFVGDEEKQYQTDANKYLYDLQQNDPAKYNYIASQILEFKGGDNTGTVDQNDLHIQKIKQAIINDSQSFNLKDKINDLNVLINRVGVDKINTYNELYKAGKEINSQFSPEELNDIQKIGFLASNIQTAQDKIKYANENIVPLAHKEQVEQQAYNEGDRINNMLKDIPKSVWNEGIKASAGILTSIKFLDHDNSYGTIDRIVDTFNEAKQDLTATTSQVPLYDEKTGEINYSRILPDIASTATMFYLLGRGGVAGKSITGSFKPGVVLTMLATSHNDYYEQARQLMTDQQATNFSLAMGGVTSILGLIAPGEAIWGEAGIAHMTLEEGMKRFAKGEALDQILKPVLKQAANINLQTGAQIVSGKIVNGVANTVIGKDALDTQYKTSEFLQQMVAATGATLLGGAFKGLTQKVSDKENLLNNLSKNEFINLSLQTIQENVNSGLITQDKATTLIEDLTKRNQQLNALPAEYNDAKKATIIDLQNKLGQFQKDEFQIQDGKIVKKEFTPDEIQSINDITSKIKESESKPNSYYDDIQKTIEQKAQELSKGNSSPIESSLSDVGEKTPEEVAVELKPIIVSNITPEAQDLLNSIGEGSAPTFITNNLRRIAAENNIYISEQTTPDDIINDLKDKQNKSVSTTSTSKDAKTSIDFTGKDNNFLANKEPNFFTPQERDSYNELMKKPETEDEAAKMVSDKKEEFKKPQIINNQNQIQNEQINQEGSHQKSGQETSTKESKSIQEGKRQGEQNVLTPVTNEKVGVDKTAPTLTEKQKDVIKNASPYTFEEDGKDYIDIQDEFKEGQQIKFKRIGEDNYRYGIISKEKNPEGYHPIENIKDQPHELSGGDNNAPSQEQVELKQNNETQNLLAGEAANRRKTGTYSKDGIVYTRNEKLKDQPSGNKGDVRFTNDVTVPFTYKLIESDQVQPSHENGLRNPNHFIPETQPKNRTDQGSLQAEESFATNPRFNELGEHTNAYSGAPVVNERGEVIQGNNRASGLKRGYEKANEQYKNDLLSNADKFGFSKDQIEAMKNPILVREVKASDEGAIELGNYDVKDLESGGKRSIDPNALSRRIPFNVKGKITKLLFKGDDKTLNTSIRDNVDKLTELLSPYLNTSQFNSIFKNGKISDTGAKDLENVLQSFLFDNGTIHLPEIFEDLSFIQKEGIRISLPYIFSTTHEKSIIPELQNAIVALKDFNTSGINNIETWKKQADIFNDGRTPNDTYTQTELKISELLNNAKTQNDIKNIFNKYAEESNGKPGDMFIDPTSGKTKQEAIKSTFNTNYDVTKNQEISPRSQEVSNTEKVLPIPEKITGNEKPESKPTEPISREEKVLDEAQQRRERIDQIESKEKEFIESISPHHSRYLATLLADGYNKEEISLTKKVRDILQEVDGVDNFGKIFKTLRENNFDVEAIISEIDPTKYEKDTYDKVIKNLRETGSDVPPNNDKGPEKERITPPDGITGVRKSILNVEHIQPEVEAGISQAVRHHEDVWNEVLAQAKNGTFDPVAFRTDILERSDKGEKVSLTDIDAFKLLYDRMNIQNNLSILNRDMRSAIEGKDVDKQADIAEQIQYQNTQLELNRLAIRKTGKEAGRGISALQAITDLGDLQLLKWTEELKQMYGVKSESKIPESAKKAIEELDKKYKEKFDELNNHLEKLKQEVADNKFNKEKAATKKTPKGKVTEFTNKIREIADKIEKSGPNLPPNTVIQGVSNKTLADAIRFIADSIDKGVEIADSISRAVKKYLGEGIDEKVLKNSIKEHLINAGLNEKDVNTPSTSDKFIEKIISSSKKENTNTLTKEAIKPLRSLIKEHILNEDNKTLADVINAVKSDLSELTGITERQIRDAYSGYGLKPETRNEVDNNYKTLKNQAAKISEYQDAKLQLEELQKTPDKNIATQERLIRKINSLYDDVNDYLKQQGISVELEPQPDLQAKQIEQLNKRIQDKIDEKKKQLDENDFTKEEPIKDIYKDGNTVKLESELRGLSKQFNARRNAFEYYNKPFISKLLRTGAQLKRAFVLSHITTLAKLGAALTENIAITPIREGIGASFYGINKGIDMALNSILDTKNPIYHNLILKANREGVPSFVAESTAWKSLGIGGKAWQDFISEAKNGYSEIGLMYGKEVLPDAPQEYKDFWFKTNKLLSYPGQIHGAIKSIPKRTEFERSYVLRKESAARHGLNVDDPIIQSDIATQAYDDATASILMKDNLLSKAWSNLIKKGWDSNSLTAQSFAFIGTEFMPIVKVPTNLVLEAGRYTIGAHGAAIRIGMGTIADAINNGIQKAGGKKSDALSKLGLEKLTPQQADAILSNLKKGSLALALNILAASIPGFIKVTPFYHKGLNNPDGLDDDEIEIGGIKIPKIFQDHPLFLSMRVHATAADLYNYYRDQYEEETKLKSAKYAAIGTLEGLANETPFMQNASNIISLLHRPDSKQTEKFMDNFIKSTVEPGLLIDIAKFHDSQHWYDPFIGKENKRETKTVGDYLQNGIPIKREKLPLKE